MGVRLGLHLVSSRSLRSLETALALPLLHSGHFLLSSAVAWLWVVTGWRGALAAISFALEVRWHSEAAGGHV